MLQEIKDLLHTPVPMEEAIEILGISLAAVTLGLVLLAILVRLGNRRANGGILPRLGIMLRVKRDMAAKPKRTPKPKRGKVPSRPRDEEWLKDEIKAAKEDRKPSLMHPTTIRRANALTALLRHNQRWNRMIGVPGGVWANIKVFLVPPQAYRSSFIRTRAYERNDEVEPYIPTGIVEAWRPKAAVADQSHKWRCDAGGNALRSPHAYMRLALPPGKRISDLRTLEELDGCEVDDYTMEDIYHVQRRSANRELQSSGKMAARVDGLAEPESAIWLQFIPHAGGVIIAAGGAIIFIAS